MEILSKALHEEQTLKQNKNTNGESGDPKMKFNFKDHQWHYKASEDDENRQAKKIWCKQQALLLASKVDRKTINDLLLKEQDVFHSTPKYLAVTKRLYRPFADQMNFNGLDDSTQDGTDSVVDCSTEWGGQ